MSINRGMDKEDVVHIYSGILTSHKIKRHLLLGRKVMTNLDSILKSRHYFADKGPSSQGYGFSISHVWI